MRALILVLDSVGIGSAPDAAQYGDLGADTLGHIVQLCERGGADNDLREGPLAIPHLLNLGMGEAYRLANGHSFDTLTGKMRPTARFACAREISKGKDTPSGHWELAGVPVSFTWGYFPKTVPCFPAALIDALCERANLPGILGNCHASGTQIIDEYGIEHISSGKPICYTSADSVFQIAAHEEAFSLERLYDICRIAYELIQPWRIARVIARPFVGYSPDDFHRTANRRDYCLAPPMPTLLDHATAERRDVVTIGKIDDIFAHSGTGRVLKENGNNSLFDKTLEGFASLQDGGLLFANFIDFDTLYGHRRDALGYALALEQFDQRLPELLACMQTNDLLIITADHGCDPLWPGTDHTREQVPILAFMPGCITGNTGRRAIFSDVAATVAAHLDLPLPSSGSPL